MRTVTINEKNYSKYGFDHLHDPVRPELDFTFRTAPGRTILALTSSDAYHAAICVAFTNTVPITVQELDFLSQAACQDGQHGSIAVAYTVWSRSPGAGRDMVFAAIRKIKQDPLVKRLVTLSPKTEMARRFHLRNGAFTLQENAETDNYEYTL